MDNPVFETEGGRVRRYFSKKNTEGEPITHFVTEGLLFKSLRAAMGGGSPPAGGWTLTDRVQEDYAAKLLPRAVGYSAALLNYFFRGEFDVALSAGSARITNRSPGETMSGRVRFHYDTASGERVLLAGPFDVTLAPDASSESLSLPPPLPDKPPARPGRYLVVFEGTLGNEVDTAVAGKEIGRPAWLQVVAQHSVPGSSTTEIIGGYEPTTSNLAEGPVTLEAFHSQATAAASGLKSSSIR